MLSELRFALLQHAKGLGLGCSFPSLSAFTLPSMSHAQAGPPTPLSALMGDPCIRQYAKTAAKGKGGKAPPPAAETKKPAAKSGSLFKRITPVYLVKKRYKSAVRPVSSILDKQQVKALQDVLPHTAAATDGSEQTADSQVQEEGKTGLTSAKDFGLPLSPRDTADLMHESFSRTMGETVQLRSFTYNSLFQSAPAVAQYVANALEAGQSWQRIERFFLSSVEEDKTIAGIKVQVRGRMGRKADMSGRKLWVKGSVALGDTRQALDYAQAQALTRLGVLGVKVWIRYTRSAARQAMSPRPSSTDDITLGLPSLTELVTSHSRLATQLLSSSPSGGAWWSLPGTQQPLLNSTWLSLRQDYNPATPVEQYLTANTPRTFTLDQERRLYYLKNILPGAGTAQKSIPAGDGSESELQTASGSTQ